MYYKIHQRNTAYDDFTESCRYHQSFGLNLNNVNSYIELLILLNHRTVVCLKRRINLPWRASSSIWNIDDISQFIVFYVLDADQSWKLLLVYADHMTLKNTMFYNGLLWRFDAFLASYWIHLTRFIYWFNTSACYTCNANVNF